MHVLQDQRCNPRRRFSDSRDGVVLGPFQALLGAVSFQHHHDGFLVPRALSQQEPRLEHEACQVTVSLPPNSEPASSAPVMRRHELPPLILLLALSVTGCAGSSPIQTGPKTDAAIKPQTKAAAPPVAAKKAIHHLPHWQSDRAGWCRMRERQKAARKSPDDRIAGTNNPYLISVHDEMCKDY